MILVSLDHKSISILIFQKDRTLRFFLTSGFVLNTLFAINKKKKKNREELVHHNPLKGNLDFLPELSKQKKKPFSNLHNVTLPGFHSGCTDRSQTHTGVLYHCPQWCLEVHSELCLRHLVCLHRTASCDAASEPQQK